MTEVDHLPRLSPGAQRMRRYRRRPGRSTMRHANVGRVPSLGARCLRFLEEDQRHNREAVADALRAYLSEWAMPPIE